MGDNSPADSSSVNRFPKRRCEPSMTSRRELANAIRALSMDAVQQAKSGHPGAPMGMADIAQVLWTEVMRHNPANPHWINRDRFVLSNGHASMLIYSLLHLTGYDVPIDELRNFRQKGSRTPGHPEYGDTPGVETTTGPLGQGLANAVGMAIAEKILGAHFNRPPLDVIDHKTYVFVGDGCLMEGVSHEAASLAGTLKLGKLIAVYDDNGISIDGKIDGWFSDDTPGRFAAYGWHVIADVDGHDADSVADALAAANAETSRPTLICARTTIGFGAPTKAGTAGSHGSPLGEDEIKGARAALDWPAGPFAVSDEVYAGWNCLDKGAAAEAGWCQLESEYAATHPQLAAELARRLAGELPDDFAAAMAGLLHEANAQGKDTASRQASGATIARLAQMMPELLGGSADLTGSNNTDWPGCKPVTGDDAGGDYLHYGVREFGMTAIANGIALHGGLIPFTGTFLIFMEYARNAVRMSALMGIRNIHVYTHDSIGQGEDGPTHQPVEQLSNLRGTPNMSVWRPCDAVETVAAWTAALMRTSGPTAIVLSRQSLSHQSRSDDQLRDIARGAYILRDADAPVAVIIATGSEVSLASEAWERLKTEGINVRVVSMPSVDAFEAQDAAYREAVLPNGIRERVAVEAAHVDYWRKWVGLDGAVVGMDSFGLSAPGAVAMASRGFTVDAVVATVKDQLAK